MRGPVFDARAPLADTLKWPALPQVLRRTLTRSLSPHERSTNTLRDSLRGEDPRLNAWLVALLALDVGSTSTSTRTTSSACSHAASCRALASPTSASTRSVTPTASASRHVTASGPRRTCRGPLREPSKARSSSSPAKVRRRARSTCRGFTEPPRCATSPARSRTTLRSQFTRRCGRRSRASSDAGHRDERRTRAERRLRCLRQHPRRHVFA